MYQTKRYEKEITVKDYLAQYVNIEEFLEYCKACKNYDRLWSCPSYDFKQEAYWKQYEKLYILGYQIFFEEGTTEAESLRIMAEVKARMSEELFAMEAAHPGSVSLSAGSCSVCGEENCTRPQGMPCGLVQFSSPHTLQLPADSDTDPGCAASIANNSSLIRALTSAMIRRLSASVVPSSKKI